MQFEMQYLFLGTDYLCLLLYALCTFFLLSLAHSPFSLRRLCNYSGSVARFIYYLQRIFNWKAWNNNYSLLSSWILCFLKHSKRLRLSRFWMNETFNIFSAEMPSRKRAARMKIFLPTQSWCESRKKKIYEENVERKVKGKCLSQGQNVNGIWEGKLFETFLLYFEALFSMN